MVKKFILNADGFGLSEAYNRAIYEGYIEGMLKSTSIVANGEAFEDAIEIFLPKCPNLGCGIQLNITEGQSLCKDLEKLTDKDQKFNNTHFEILKKTYNPKDKTFLEEVEMEFRKQIELVKSKTEITHIDSHSHIHAIPKIFKLTCKLAQEYGIKQVRTHFERPYFIPDLHKYLSKTYYKNILNTTALNLFSLFNEASANDAKLTTNDYLIGTSYAGIMDSMAISYAISAINNENITVEAVINPCRYEDGTIDNHFQEFMITKNKKLQSRIEHLGYNITNYAEKN